MTGLSTVGVDAAGIKTEGKEIILSRMMLAGLEVQGLPTMCDDANTIMFSDEDTANDHPLLLGNDVFNGTVLTIDYHRKQLLIHDSTYDFNSQHAGGYLLGIASPSPTNLINDKLNVPGSIAGKPVIFNIDTGWNGSDLGLSEELASRLKKKPSERRRVHTTHGTQTAEYVSDIAWTLDAARWGKAASLTGHSPATLYPASSLGADATIGGKLLQRYRVTIDYPRQRILLEPYDKG